MIRLETQYYSLNRILLLVVGLWPYQQSKFTQLQFIFFSAILSTGIIFQLTPLIILKCTLDLVIKVLSSASFFILCTIQYNAFRINIEPMKNLLMELRYILNELKDKNEIAIVYKYSGFAKRYTIILTVLGICAIFIIITAQIWSFIANVNVPLNISQPHHLLIITEYFVHQEKYFYFILLHMYTVICVGMIIIIATGSLLIMYLQYTCGMFRIASYRIDHAMSVNMLQNITLKNKILMTKGIIYAIDIHRQAIKLSKHLMSPFEVMICCLIVCGVICVSINLFQIFQILSFKNNVYELLFPFIFATVTILYMFISNYIGQNIIDHSNHVYSTVYNVQWYRAPIHVQRMILFLLQRKTKEFILTFCGLFNASIECFATLIKSSVSYFTVIYSTR